MGWAKKIRSPVWTTDFCCDNGALTWSHPLKYTVCFWFPHIGGGRFHNPAQPPPPPPFYPSHHKKLWSAICFKIMTPYTCLNKSVFLLFSLSLKLSPFLLHEHVLSLLVSKLCILSLHSLYRFHVFCFVFSHFHLPLFPCSSTFRDFHARILCHNFETNGRP